jgi:hypothetical protein
MPWRDALLARMLLRKVCFSRFYVLLTSLEAINHFIRCDTEHS